MNKETIKHKNIASIIAIGMLLLAIPSGFWPYGYYIFLRWVVTGAALFVLWTSYELKKQSWTWIMGITAVLFNPIASIHLDKETWVIINFVVAGLFLVSIFQIKSRNMEEEKNVKSQKGLSGNKKDEKSYRMHLPKKEEITQRDTVIGYFSLIGMVLFIIIFVSFLISFISAIF